MKFTKMQGTGNDYIYINCVYEPFPEDPIKLAMILSDRHYGIGSDGLIFICPSIIADFEMVMFNADGSRSQMCGNGIRCVGKYVYDFGLTKKTQITIDTLAGVKQLLLNVSNDKVTSIRVNMGTPIFDPALLPMYTENSSFINLPLTINNFTYLFTAVSMGNPHIVAFVDDVKTLDLPTIGPLFENHPMFPERVNVEFARIINRREIEMRVWERGSNETLSCGTGACATLAAAVKNGLCDRSVKLHLLGGSLDITWEQDDIYMTGNAKTVFSGEVDIDNLIDTM